MQEVSKPLPCNQKWDNMIPAKGGRICLGCGKLVTDFRKKSWSDISKIHGKSLIPVCGIYTDEQLNSWGNEIFVRQYLNTKIAKLSAAFFAITQLLPVSLQSQTKQLQQQTQTIKQPVSNNKTVSKQVKRYISGTIVLLQSDSAKMPVKGVSVSIFQDSLHLKTRSDSVGRFVIDITKQFHKLPDKISLIISHPDYQIQTYRISKKEQKSIDITLRNMGVESNEIKLVTHMSYFYAMPPQKKSSNEKDTLVTKKKWWQIYK